MLAANCASVHLLCRSSTIYSGEVGVSVSRSPGATDILGHHVLFGHVHAQPQLTFRLVRIQHSVILLLTVPDDRTTAVGAASPQGANHILSARTVDTSTPPYRIVMSSVLSQKGAQSCQQCLIYKNCRLRAWPITVSSSVCIATPVLICWGQCVAQAAEARL